MGPSSGLQCHIGTKDLAGSTHERITPRRTSLPSATVADTAEQRVYKDFAERDLKQRSYLPKEFILCTLPHSNPGDVRVWSRRNGNYLFGGVRAVCHPQSTPFRCAPGVPLASSVAAGVPRNFGIHGEKGKNNL